MQTARKHFFSRTTFTQQEDCRAGPSDFLDSTTYPQHLGITRDETTERVGLLHRLQASVVLLQVVKPKRAIDREPEQLGFERLCEKIIGAQCNCAQCVGPVV